MTSPSVDPSCSPSVECSCSPSVELLLVFISPFYWLIFPAVVVGYYLFIHFTMTSPRVDPSSSPSVESSFSPSVELLLISLALSIG